MNSPQTQKKPLQTKILFIIIGLLMLLIAVGIPLVQNKINILLHIAPMFAFSLLVSIRAVNSSIGKPNPSPVYKDIAAMLSGFGVIAAFIINTRRQLTGEDIFENTIILIGFVSMSTVVAAFLLAYAAKIPIKKK